jgi:hypothetical protein
VFYNKKNLDFFKRSIEHEDEVISSANLRILKSENKDPINSQKIGNNRFSLTKNKEKGIKNNSFEKHNSFDNRQIESREQTKRSGLNENSLIAKISHNLSMPNILKIWNKPNDIKYSNTSANNTHTSTYDNNHST